MRLATTPAPKPLSIFTTVTFDAQLFNMPSKAATPLKLAPYPKSALHSRGHDQHACLCQALAPVEQTMEAGDADVIKSLDVISHHL
jgi:hypothetical protein